MACVGGGIDVNWLVLAAACCVRGLVSGGGRGGVVWGWRCWWCGGRGWVLCWLGVWASQWVAWVLRVCAVRPLRFLTGCGAGVWVGGGRMNVRVGLWSVCNGWLLVDGARWYGVWVGGLLVVVGWGGRSLQRLGKNNVSRVFGPRQNSAGFSQNGVVVVGWGGSPPKQRGGCATKK